MEKSTKAASRFCGGERIYGNDERTSGGTEPPLNYGLSP